MDLNKLIKASMGNFLDIDMPNMKSSAADDRGKRRQTEKIVDSALNDEVGREQIKRMMDKAKPVRRSTKKKPEKAPAVAPPPQFTEAEIRSQLENLELRYVNFINQFGEDSTEAKDILDKMFELKKLLNSGEFRAAGEPSVSEEIIDTEAEDEEFQEQDEEQNQVTPTTQANSPEELKKRIDELGDFIYNLVNEGKSNSTEAQEAVAEYHKLKHRLTEYNAAHGIKEPPATITPATEETSATPVEEVTEDIKPETTIPETIDEVQEVESAPEEEEITPISPEPVEIKDAPLVAQAPQAPAATTPTVSAVAAAGNYITQKDTELIDAISDKTAEGRLIKALYKQDNGKLKPVSVTDVFASDVKISYTAYKNIPINQLGTRLLISKDDLNNNNNNNQPIEQKSEQPVVEPKKPVVPLSNANTKDDDPFSDPKLHTNLERGDKVYYSVNNQDGKTQYYDAEVIRDRGDGTVSIFVIANGNKLKRLVNQDQLHAKLSEEEDPLNDIYTIKIKESVKPFIRRQLINVFKIENPKEFKLITNYLFNNEFVAKRVKTEDGADSWEIGARPIHHLTGENNVVIPTSWAEVKVNNYGDDTTFVDSDQLIKYMKQSSKTITYKTINLGYVKPMRSTMADNNRRKFK